MGEDEKKWKKIVYEGEEAREESGGAFVCKQREKERMRESAVHLCPPSV